MLTQIINGQILTPQGWLKDGSVLISDGKILEVTNSDLAVIGAKVVDAKGMYIIPGFVAMNVHGGGGHDFKECTEEAFHSAIAAHMKHGATTIFPTLSSSPKESICKAVSICEKLMAEKDGPVLGLHVEGPYLNAKMAGNLYDVKNPDKEEYMSILESTNCIKRWDASPELPGAHDFARYLRSKGILAAITHTEAEFEDIKEAYAAGFTHAAQFYNAMPGFHKRREYKYEGTVESVFLMDDMTVEVISICEKLMAEKDGPVLGLHVEGPYLNAKMAGNLYDVKNPDKEEYMSILESTNCIKRWDASPELPGAHDFARYLRSKGILAAITHTEAEFEDIKEAYAAGFTHAAQFYNAMPGFHKRREYKYEGTVESVFLMDDMTVEVIADGKHLPSTILRLVYKLKGVERTCLVTDALSYAASDVKPDEGSRIIIEDGVCKLADHSSLAGSIATMDVLVRTMVQKANIPLADAVRMASETPARLMGVSDRTGTLQRGKDADIIILDRNLTVRAVWSMGNLVPAANTLF